MATKFDIQPYKTLKAGRMKEGTVELDLLEEDDLVIVSETRKRAAPATSDQTDDDLCIVACNIGNNAIRRKRHATVDTDVIEVLDEPPSKRPLTQQPHVVRKEKEPENCKICGDSFSDFTFTRCKHTLCSICVAECVMLDGGRAIREVAVCPVPKCKAPLSTTEKYDVLLRAEIDAYAVEPLKNFRTKCGIASKQSAGTMVNLTEGRAIFDETSDDGSWLNKEPEDAFGGLVSKVPGSLVALCNVCSAEFAPDRQTPHCPEARAIGFMEIIRRLRTVYEGRVVTFDGILPSTLLEEYDAEQGEETVAPTTASKSKLKAAAKVTKRRRSTKCKSGFTKGTGYGGTAGPEWTGIQPDKKAKLAETDAVVSYYLGILLPYFDFSDENLATWPSYFRLLVRHSGYLGFLGNLLMSASMMEVGNRPGIYIAAVLSVRALVLSTGLRSLAVTPLWDDGRTMVSTLDVLATEAAVLSNGAGMGILPASTASFCGYLRRARRCIRNSLDDIGGEAVSKTEVAENSPEEENKRRYLDTIKELQFQTVPGLAGRFTYANEAIATARSQFGDAGPRSRQRLLRLSREIASLATALPCEYETSIAICVDHDRYDCLQALILGPEGTPYSNGVFLFDIFLPVNYPTQPPLVKFLTTGGGRYRLNPNLYAEGKVCLSLLGTWQGPSWTSASTLLQVLVSIQSLILVSDPYFNEPGFEASMGTVTGTKNSKRYNATIQSYTVAFALIGAAQSTPDHFRRLVNSHLALKKESILAQVREWQPGITVSSGGIDATNKGTKINVPGTGSDSRDFVTGEMVTRLRETLNNIQL